MKRATIADVASRAGVSKATVSHVVNKTRFVEESTTKRVLAAIEETGYRPSGIARSLTTNRTETIGVIVSDVSNAFFGDLLRGIEDVLRPMNYGLVVCNTDEILEYEDKYVDILLRQRVDGIIAAATSQRWGILEKAQGMHTPVVFTDRAFEGLEGPFVGVDNEGGAKAGTGHLIGAGHRKIGILAGLQRLSTMRERLRGFRAALRESGIAPNEDWIMECPLTVDAARMSAKRLMSMGDRPTALFASNNLLSLGALLAIRETGLCCPAEIALVGFDDHPWAAVADPPLTVVRQPSRGLGQEAARTMVSLIAGEQSGATRTILPCELVLRQSCCAAH
jgi:LacI family transcriptional regulator